MGSQPPSTWREADASALDWLIDTGQEVGCTSFDVGGFADCAWVLNAMYERVGRASDLTHDETYHRDLDQGRAEREMVGDVDLTDVGVVTGGGLGWSRHPGAGYRRLQWQDYADRFGARLVSPGRWPGIDGALRVGKPTGSWPEDIEPPTEGSLDVESWLRLTELLARHSAAGGETLCTTYFTPWTGAQDVPYLLRGRLADAADLIDHPHRPGSPQNLWPDDRAWFVMTDYDLWATRVRGSAGLVAALLADAELDAARLPDVPDTV